MAHSVSIPETRIWQDIGSMFILIARLVGPIQRGHLTPLATSSYHNNLIKDILEMCDFVLCFYMTVVSVLK